MPDERFEEHLRHPRGRGRGFESASHGVAGGAACGDLVRISLVVDGERVSAAGFEADGCGSLIAAASAAVELVERVGSSILRESARRRSRLSWRPQRGQAARGRPASDALHRALGAAARAHGA